MFLKHLEVWAEGTVVLYLVTSILKADVTELTVQRYVFMSSSAEPEVPGSRVRFRLGDLKGEESTGVSG